MMAAGLLTFSAPERAEAGVAECCEQSSCLRTNSRRIAVTLLLQKKTHASIIFIELGG